VRVGHTGAATTSRREPYRAHILAAFTLQSRGSVDRAVTKAPRKRGAAAPARRRGLASGRRARLPAAPPLRPMTY